MPGSAAARGLAATGDHAFANTVLGAGDTTLPGSGRTGGGESALRRRQVRARQRAAGEELAATPSRVPVYMPRSGAPAP